MVAEFGQQLWLCMNFRCSDRTLRSRDRILDFSQEMVKTSAGAENLPSAEVLTSRAGTTGRYSTGEMPPIQAERPVPSDHLRSTCTRGNTFFLTVYLSKQGNDDMYKTGSTSITSHRIFFYPRKDDIFFRSIHRQHYLQGSEWELFSQTWRKSTVGDSAEPK
jgi:hypothetical protein